MHQTEKAPLLHQHTECLMPYCYQYYSVNGLIEKNAIKLAIILILERSQLLKQLDFYDLFLTTGSLTSIWQSHL